MNELKKTIKKRNEYCKKISAKYSINLTTVKKYFDENIYCDDSGKAINFDKESFLRSLNQVKNNQSKRPHKTAKTALLIPNTSVLWNLIEQPLSVHARGQNEASNYADYSHVIQTKDYYSEEYKICRNEMEKVIFHGFTFYEFIIISAIYTLIHNNICTEDKNTITGHELKVIDTSAIFELLNPGKRWDKASKKAIGKLLSAIISLKKKLQNLNSDYWCKGLREAIYKESGRSIFELSIKKYHPERPEATQFAVYQEKDNLLQFAENQRRILTINSELLKGTNTGNNTLARIYIARRIAINSNKMLKKIDIKKMENMIGKTDKKQIKKYLDSLQDKGYISEYTVTRSYIQWKPVSVAGKTEKQVILMNDKDGKRIKLENIPEAIKKTEKRIKEINKFNGKHDVSINGKQLETDVAAVYCRDDFGKGGRLYSGKNGYQGLKSEQRKKIKIDGKKTVELDYSAYHPHLLYAIKGIQLNNDPYSFYGDRNTAKKALNIAINAKNEKECIYAIMEATNLNQDQTKDLMKKMNQHHAEIQEYFYSDSGVILQNIDSQLAIKIVEAMQKKGIPCLPVHDSFICPESEKKTLYFEMNEIFKSEMNGIFCPIK